MAVSAPKLVEKRLTLFRHGTLATTGCEPDGIIGLVHDVNRANHTRVFRTAVLCTKDVKSPGLGRPEPFRRIFARQDVSFCSESGYVEVMKYIFRGHRQLDVPVDGDVELIDFASAFHVLHLPHPLFPGDVDLH